MRQFDFDAEVDGAWRAFAVALADRLATLKPGDEHVVEQAREFPDGPHGVLTFTRTRARRLRCTAHVLDLHPTAEFKLQQLDILTDAGWRLLRDNRLIFEVGARRADELAHIAVTALREIWEVVHPTFLVGARGVVAEPSVAVGVIPDCRDHLLSLVVAALEAIAGGRITVDEDGDIPLPTRTVPSWLRVLDEEAAVEFFATVIGEVPDIAAASAYIAAESVRWPGITLTLHQTSLMAFSTIGMTAFHRENLTTGLGRWLEFMAESAPDVIAALTKVERELPRTEGDDERLPDPLQTLIVLDEDGTSLDAHEVATICRHDQSAVLRYIHTSQEQYLAWMKSAVEADVAGDHDEAAACRHEERAWRATTDKLRDALRIIVLRGGETAERDRRPSG